MPDTTPILIKFCKFVHPSTKPCTAIGANNNDTSARKMTEVNTSRQTAPLKFLRGGFEELGGREIRKNDARFTI